MLGDQHRLLAEGRTPSTWILDSLALSVIVAMTNLRFRQNSEKRLFKRPPTRYDGERGRGPRLHDRSSLEALRMGLA